MKKTVFITGSSRGVGFETAIYFLYNDYNVIINSSNENNLHKALNDLKEQFPNNVIDGFVCDVADESKLNKVYKSIKSNHGKLDVLVNNAGILGDARIGMISSDLINKVLDINVKGVIYNLQLAQKLMKNGGSIINISSIIGTNGNIGQTVYAASKSAVIGITKSAAKELASKNIRVNCICPGFINTDMTRGLSEDIYNERIQSIKMGRIGEPIDIAKCIYFLASNESLYITGQVIGVDGGMLI